MAYKTAVAWAGLFALAFVNGALRELAMKKLFGMTEPFAHQLSCATGIIIWTSFVLAIWSWLGIDSLRQSALVGATWFVATMLVETFVLNRNLSWQEIQHTYNIAAGEFWGVVLLWIGVLPIVLFMIKRQN